MVAVAEYPCRTDRTAADAHDVGRREVDLDADLGVLLAQRLGAVALLVRKARRACDEAFAFAGGGQRRQRREEVGALRGVELEGPERTAADGDAIRFVDQLRACPYQCGADGRVGLLRKDRHVVQRHFAGNGSRHEPKAGQTEKYREALRLYRDTALTHRQIAEATGITVTGLRNHLRIWNRRLIVEHRGYECREGEAVDLSRTKQYLKSTAAKYAGAIACLKETGRPTAEVAREFGLHPETFREYVREHEPELAARLGMTRLAGGRQVLARSMEKYGEAVRLYETTTEPLRSIADRLGLQYNSVGGFVRRSRPDAIEAHNRLVEREEALRKEKEQAESAALALQREAEEKERILSALRQTGGNKRKAAKLLGFCKSTLYNKLNALGLNDTGDT